MKNNSLSILFCFILFCFLRGKKIIANNHEHELIYDIVSSNYQIEPLSVIWFLEEKTNKPQNTKQKTNQANQTVKGSNGELFELCFVYFPEMIKQRQI